MKKLLRRWALAAAVSAVGTSVLLTGSYLNHGQARADSPSVQVASVDQLKAEAFRALRVGEFEKVEKLLGQAASQSNDPTLAKMVGWTKQFEAQQAEFTAERNKQYGKAVEDVKKLEKAGMLDYAPDAAARAFLLAPDKKAFRTEQWVDELIKTAVSRAEDHEKNERWIKALRLYSDLGSLEPSLPVWKERLKVVTRRVRLVALYTPEVMKATQEAETKDREEADAILKPGATTKSATRPASEDAEAFKNDWKDMLRGVRMDLLWDALVYAKTNYYRETTYKDLALGGLNGIRTLVTTKGLEKAFPALGDEGKRQQFLAFLDERIAANKDAVANSEQVILRDTLAKLKTENGRTIELPEQVLVSEFADGALAELDPFTSMIWPADLDEFRKSVGGKFYGVGVQIQSDEDGSLRVISPLEDSPAYKAGIKAGDVITHINGKSAKGITTSQAVRTITGPKGTKVTLTVRSQDATSKDYDITRDEIKVQSIKGFSHRNGGGWDYYIDPESKIAYVRLTNFTSETEDELNATMADLEKTGAKGMILDLRYNPGGLLTAAIAVCDKFLSDGVIVSTRPDRQTANPPTVNRAKKDADESSLPLIVLVNQYSASASEIVSGCLKDQKRATVIGERTFGKGSVQMLYQLSNDKSALLKLTTSHYYLPGGTCIHREENSTKWGVEPDLTLEMTPEQMRSAIDARQDLDILRDAEGKVAPATKPSTSLAKPKKTLLESDPQLSAAVLMLRLELADTKIAAAAK